jgi:hypothetical protein
MQKHYLTSILWLCLLAMGCNDPVPAANEDHVPLTKGSWWTYRFIENGTGSTNTIQINVQEDTETIQGKQYFKLSEPLPFIALNNDKIRFEADLYWVATPSFVPIQATEVAGLMTEQRPDSLLEWTVYNYTWNPSGYLFKSCKQVAFLPEFQVDGTSYTDVLQVECTEYTGNPSSSRLDIAYFAKGIGLIKCIRSSSHGTDGTYELTDYHIE